MCITYVDKGYIMKIIPVSVRQIYFVGILKKTQKVIHLHKFIDDERLYCNAVIRNRCSKS